MTATTRDGRVLDIASAEYEEYHRVEVIRDLYPDEDLGPWPMRTPALCVIGGCVCAVEPPTTVERRVTAKVSDRAAVLQAYQERRAEIYRLNPDRPRFLIDIYYAKPKEVYRWLVELSCGCAREEWTAGEDRLPRSQRHRDYSGRFDLPAGQRTCYTHGEGSFSTPYRTIVKYRSRKQVTRPADHPDQPGYLGHLGPQFILRREPETVAQWRVLLCCGHETKDATKLLDWRPADGLKPASEEDFQRAKAVHANMDAEFVARFPVLTAHYRRLLDAGRPDPEPETSCYTCVLAFPIVAYQRVGWLVPRQELPKPPKPPSQASLKRRLRDLERQAQDLRDRLAEAEQSGKPTPAAD